MAWLPDFAMPLQGLTCAFGLASLYVCWRKFKHTRLPPGPSGYPIIGSMLSMPTSEEWLYWSKLSERYGPVVSVRVLGQPIIILNTIEACVNLLDKRSGVYSGRPILQFAGKMVGWDRQMILCEDGERHKAMRRMFARHIGTRETISEYHDMQETEARRFVVAATSDPDHLLKHIRLAISAMFLKITHGYNIERKSPDPLVSLIEKAAEEFYIAAAPGAWLVDILPWVQHLPRWFPGTRFKDIASCLRETCVNQTTIPIQFVKHQMKHKEGRPCFTSHILERALTPLEDEIYPYIATSLYAGGQDTVSATLGTFFLAMLLYPDVQRQAQAELDNLLGSSRVPTPAELEQLPYLQAVFKEVLRWHTVACLNLPHMATKDDVYNGHYIPKGSIILANLWSIANNPSIYSQPSVFDPKRFLGQIPETDPHSFVFGFGKRRCPGIELARRSCMFFMATTLAVVDICKARGPTGEEITPSPEFFSGTVCHPKPFSCDVRARSADAKALIDTWAEEASDENTMFKAGLPKAENDDLGLKPLANVLVAAFASELLDTVHDKLCELLERARTEQIAGGTPSLDAGKYIDGAHAAGEAADRGASVNAIVSPHALPLELEPPPCPIDGLRPSC